MGAASLTGRRVRRVIGLRYLRWRTLRSRDTAVRYLGLLAVALERHGWRCAMCCPEWTPAGTPLLRIYGPTGPVTIVNVLALPGRRWGYHEAARGRGGFLCECGGDVKYAAQVIDRFLQDR